MTTINTINTINTMNRIDPIKAKTIKTAGGFSLIETMITMALFFIIMWGVYAMILQYGDLTRTEQSRIKLQQDTRFMETFFTDELKNAGAVLTLGTGLTFSSVSEGAKFTGFTPAFCGIFPINNSYYSDGIILASGDPEAKTNLSVAYNPGGTVLSVDSTLVPGYDASNPNEIRQWAAGDQLIILGADSYYIGLVTAVDTGANTITIRDTPVYFSGLLNTRASAVHSTPYYIDYWPTKGDSVTYPKDSPVIRLSNFSIYLIKEVFNYSYNREVRQLYRLTDANGIADALADNSSAELSIISENIWDMQISYVAYTSFSTTDRLTTVDPAHHYFAGGSTSSDLTNLMTDMRARALKQINIQIVSISDEFSGIGSTANNQIPALYDEPTYSLPDGKHTSKVVSLSVEPRNFSVYSFQ
ncbi:MAG: PilW family protein [Candidatus Omnitrophota bacterium]